MVDYGLARLDFGSFGFVSQFTGRLAARRAEPKVAVMNVLAVRPEPVEGFCPVLCKCPK